MLKEESDKKINMLVKVHLRELEELNREIRNNKEVAVAALEIKDAELVYLRILREGIKKIPHTGDTKSLDRYGS